MGTRTATGAGGHPFGDPAVITRENLHEIVELDGIGEGCAVSVGP